MGILSIVIIAVILNVVFLVAAFLFLLGVLKRQISQEVRTNQEQFLRLAKQQFEAEQNRSVTELELRKQAVENSVYGLKEELAKYQALIHELEKERDTKYGNIEAALRNTSEATLNLQDTTNRLVNILGNVRIRGQWGERMAEEIVRASGLIEGINYKKQTRLDTSLTRPDFTFLLPDGHKVNMDVKFPLDNYMEMVNADQDETKERFFKDFEKNVRRRIKEIQNRNYINPDEKTLDFVLLFIPNEQVFGLIQERMPGLMDEALKQKVVLCSPFTLYAMLSVIRQAFENFRYEKDIKKIIRLIDQFVTLYTRFKSRFEEIGKAVDKLVVVYSDIKDKNFKNMDTKIRHIDNYRKGRVETSQKEMDENFIEKDASENIP